MKLDLTLTAALLACCCGFAAVVECYIAPICTASIRTIVCYNGTWPTTEAEIAAVHVPLTPNVTRLFIDSITFFKAELIQPFPALATPNNVIELDLRNITSLNSDSVVVGFPFARFTAGLDKSQFQRLSIWKVNLQTIGEDYFSGFTGLQELWVSESTIIAIHPRSFYGFARGLPPTASPTSVEYTSALKKVHFLSIFGLAAFPWDILLPVSGSIEVNKLLH